MNKDELRPCTVRINMEVPTIRNQCANMEKIDTQRKGYFHTWANGYCVFGIVEYEDGTVQRVLPECITFTDRRI